MAKNREIPVKISPAELAQLRADAKSRDKKLSHYVRGKLGLPIPKMGRPWPSRQIPLVPR